MQVAKMKNHTAQVLPTTNQAATLSEALIPAEKGEFYDYAYLFIANRPIFALLKCKSQKGRPLAQLSELGSEANILFCFGDSDQVVTHSVSAANEAGLLKHKFEPDFFGETYLGIANISRKDFHSLRSAQDVASLTKICKDACCDKNTLVTLTSGLVFAVVTDSGKFGLFLVEAIDSRSMKIEACHILV